MVRPILYPENLSNEPWILHSHIPSYLIPDPRSSRNSGKDFTVSNCGAMCKAWWGLHYVVLPEAIFMLPNWPHANLVARSAIILAN